MTTTTQQHAIDLMPQLRDILHLPEDLDLPPLAAVKFEASQGTPGWTVAAQMCHRDYGAETWAALRAWASASGSEIVMGKPYASSSGACASGIARKISLTVVIAEVSVEVWDAVDALFVPPPAEPVRVTGSFAELLIGGAS